MRWSCAGTAPSAAASVAWESRPHLLARGAQSTATSADDTGPSTFHWPPSNDSHPADGGNLSATDIVNRRRLRNGRWLQVGQDQAQGSSTNLTQSGRKYVSLQFKFEAKLQAATLTEMFPLPCTA